MIVHPPAVRSTVLRAQLQLLLLAVEHATPGPWDVSYQGAVVGPATGIPRYPEEFSDYGGMLVCESIHRADAVVVAAARNLLPQLVHAYLEAHDENHTLSRANYWLRVANEDLRAQQNDELRSELDRCREKLRSLAEHAEEAARLP